MHVDASVLYVTCAVTHKGTSTNYMRCLGWCEMWGGGEVKISHRYFQRNRFRQENFKQLLSFSFNGFYATFAI